MNTFKLHIEEGEQKGEEFTLAEGDNLIGRSHRARVRLNSDTVSREHAMLSVKGRAVTISNLSAKGTSVEDRKLEGEETLSLRTGQIIRVGTNTLRFEQVGAGDTMGSAPTLQTVETSAPAVAATRPEKTATGPAQTRRPTGGGSNFDRIMREKAAEVDLDETPPPDGGTVAQRTEYLTPEEVQRQLESQRVGTRRRAVLILVASVFLLTGIFLVLPKPGGDGKIQFDNSYTVGREAAPKGGFTVLYPKNDSSKVEHPSDGLLISTLLGRNQDVRLVIRLQESEDPKWATQDGDASLQDWIKSQTDRVFGQAYGRFEGSQNGIWVWTVPYFRNGSESVVGEARVFCYGRRLEAISAEVPATDQGRAESMYKGCTYFEFPPELEASAWTGRAVKSPVSTAVLFDEIGADLRREAPLTWAPISQQLMQILSQSVAAGNADDEERALTLLETLRQQQGQWYNSQRLLVANLTRAGDRKGIAALAQNCRAVFSDQSDKRYYEVRKW